MKRSVKIPQIILDRIERVYNEELQTLFEAFLVSVGEENRKVKRVNLAEKEFATRYAKPIFAAKKRRNEKLRYYSQYRDQLQRLRDRTAKKKGKKAAKKVTLKEAQAAVQKLADKEQKQQQTDATAREEREKETIGGDTQTSEFGKRESLFRQEPHWVGIPLMRDYVTSAFNFFKDKATQISLKIYNSATSEEEDTDTEFSCLFALTDLLHDLNDAETKDGNSGFQVNGDREYLEGVLLFTLTVLDNSGITI